MCLGRSGEMVGVFVGDVEGVGYVVVGFWYVVVVIVFD